MTISRVTAVYFSPTGGTGGYVRVLAGQLAPACRERAEIDLTDRTARAAGAVFSPDELVVVGVPVYYGRVPQLPGGLLDGLEGNGAAAVLAAVYGNRAVDDALLELADDCERRGFRVLAAASLVAPHTFSGKIGQGRPNDGDRAALAAFAGQLNELLDGECAAAPALPGNRPYREFQTAPFFPKGSKACTACGRCAARCPTGAIPPDRPRQTDKALCLRCLACVAVCPQKARSVGGPIYPLAVKKLEGSLVSPERPPEFFLP